MPKRTRESGMSLVEVMLCIPIVTIGLVAYSLSNYHTVRLSETSRANDDIALSLRNALGQLRNDTFSDLASNYGFGSGQESFWINSAGEVVFTQPAGVLAEGTYEFFLEEDAIPVQFGMPGDALDLDADGTIESGVVADYHTLPVEITITVERSFETYQQAFPLLLSD